MQSNLTDALSFMEVYELHIIRSLLKRMFTDLELWADNVCPHFANKEIVNTSSQVT